jgi:hypothetical protein
MNPFSFITQPIGNLWDAVAAPFRAIFVVGLCYFINMFTSPNANWWKWVAFGMIISVIVAWARAFKTIALLLAAYYVGRWVYRKYGEDAKAKFDEWMNGKSPTAAQPKEAQEVLRLIESDVNLKQAGIVA